MMYIVYFDGYSTRRIVHELHGPFPGEDLQPHAASSFA